MLSDFDIEGMSKPQKLVYYLKNYGVSYAGKKALKKFGVKMDEESEYMTWCRRNSYSRAELKAQTAYCAEQQADKMFTVLLAKGDRENFSNREAARHSWKKQSCQNVQILEAEHLQSQAVLLDRLKTEYTVLAEDTLEAHPQFLYEVLTDEEMEGKPDFFYSDEDTRDGKKELRPFFKPDMSPEFLFNFQYTGGCVVIRTELLLSILEEKRGFELFGNHWYALVLEVFERTEKIRHISKVLFSNFNEGNGFVRSTASSQKKCLEKFVKEQNIDAELVSSDVEGFYHLRYALKGQPKISIIIPNMDHTEDLDICIQSILHVNRYENFEVVIAENNSTKEETFAYYKTIQELDERIKVVNWEGKEFNYSAINNFGVKAATGELLLFLNNDTQIINAECLEELAAACQRPGIAASGAMLYYDDDTIQHGGVIIGMGGFAAHALWSLTDRDEKYYPFSLCAKEVGGVTGACLMMQAAVFEEVKGFDEDFRVALNDIDLCMRITAAGHEILFQPYAKLYHFESKSRGYEDTQEKQARFQLEIDRFQERWKSELEAGDPYYNRNLTLHRADYSMDI